MRFHSDYVRGAPVHGVERSELETLAAALLAAPVELELTGQGARQQRRNLGCRAAAAALARRNVRSLLARSRAEDVPGALAVALTAPAREAEDALDEAGLELNLRQGLFLNPDADLRLDQETLVIADGGEEIGFTRQELRDRGRRYFCAEALARMSGLSISSVRFSASAVRPLALQLPDGGVMDPDIAHARLRKAAWRFRKRPQFEKRYCLTCARCFVHCPENAIMHAPFDPASAATTGILGIDMDRCTGCGICAAVCTSGANGPKAMSMVDVAAEVSCAG